VKNDRPTRFAIQKRPAADTPPQQQPAAVEIHIEELTLHDFYPANRYTIADAVERELSLLLEGGGAHLLLRRDAHTPRVNAGKFAVARGSPGEVIGMQVAQALHRGLSLPAKDSKAARNGRTRTESGSQ